LHGYINIHKYEYTDYCSYYCCCCVYCCCCCCCGCCCSTAAAANYTANALNILLLLISII
jgi:hypothetical protein